MMKIVVTLDIEVMFLFFNKTYLLDISFSVLEIKEIRCTLIFQPWFRKEIIIVENFACNLSLLLKSYSKCIIFGDVFFLAPLAVVSIRQIKYIAKCASI